MSIGAGKDHYWKRHDNIYPSDSFYHLAYDLTQDDANMSKTKTNPPYSFFWESNSEHHESDKDKLLLTDETTSYSKSHKKELEPTDEFDFYKLNNP